MEDLDINKLEKVLSYAMPSRTQQQFLRNIIQGVVGSLNLLPCQIRLMKETKFKDEEGKDTDCFYKMRHLVLPMKNPDKNRFVCIERCGYCIQERINCPELP